MKANLDELGAESLEDLKEMDKEDVEQLKTAALKKMKKLKAKKFSKAIAELVAVTIADAYVSAFAPPSIEPDSVFRLNIWAYVREQMEYAVEQERKGGRVLAEQTGPLALPFGTVTVKLQLAQGFLPEEGSVSFEWSGDSSKAQFKVACQPKACFTALGLQGRLLGEGPEGCGAVLWSACRGCVATCEPDV
eukprot:COSAG04_NODE_1572_length_6292_cov_6.243178_7_plen_191_part_00